MNATKEAIYVILLQRDDQQIKQLIAYMSRSLLDNELKYSLIEKHNFSLVKVIQKM